MKNFNYNQGFDFNETFDFFKHQIESEIQSFNTMSQEDYMFESKIEEMNQYFTIGDLPYLKQLKNKFWKFYNLQDLDGCLQQLKDIKPCIIPGNENWVNYRRLISSAVYSGNGGLGRSMRFFVIDKTTNTLLGLIEVKSDFKNLKSRDKFIGWNSELKNQHKKLNNVAIMSTLIPTPEFGFNVNGGKLIAFLSLSDVIRDSWFKKYNDVLEGISTTSLYGHKKNGSIYTGNRYFKSLGSSNGDVVFTFPDELYKSLKNIISIEFPEEFHKISNGTNPKQRLLDFILKKYKINRKLSTHGFQRGVYFSKFYTETIEHLNNKNMKQYTPKFEYKVQDIFDEWLPKSLNRFEKLYRNNNLKTNFKTYENLVYKN